MRAALAVLTVVAALPFGAPTTPTVAEGDLAPDDPWIATPAQEEQLVEFQTQATAAGALGFYRSADSRALVVVLPDSNLNSATLANLSSPVPLRTETSPLDQVKVAEIEAALAELGASPSGARASLAYFFNAEVGLVTVSTTLDETTVAGALGPLARYIDYRYAELHDAGRFNDQPAFWGGAALNAVDWGEPDWDCTSGFTMINASGQKGLVTVAHCGNLLHPDMETPAGLAVGTLENRHCPNENADVELIRGQNYGKSIYVGTTQAGNGRVVSDAGTPAVGVLYRFSGAKSYERTNQKVVSINGNKVSDVCEQLQAINQLIVWHRERVYDEVCDVQPGDSGGPFYINYSSSVGIRGMVIAYDGYYCYGMRYTRIEDVLTGGWSIYK